MVEQSPGDGRTTGRLTGGAIASLSGVGLLVIFMIQNTDDVNLDFLFWGFTWPLWLLCLLMALVGGDRVVRIGRPASSPAPQGPPLGPQGAPRGPA